jgi:hypothetical protein
LREVALERIDEARRLVEVDFPSAFVARRHRPTHSAIAMGAA